MLAFWALHLDSWLPYYRDKKVRTCTDVFVLKRPNSEICFMTFSSTEGSRSQEIANATMWYVSL
jgi:hypothetical protein